MKVKYPVSALTHIIGPFCGYSLRGFANCQVDLHSGS
jgi:hypothetical protein